MNPNQQPERSDQELDRLLGQWQSANEPAAEHYQQLESNLLRTITDPAVRSAVDHSLSVGSPTPSRRRDSAWFLCGAAVALALTMITIRMIETPPSPDSRSASSDQLPPQFAFLQQSDLQQQAELLSHVNASMGQEVSWVAETSSGLEFGWNESDETVQKQQPIAVRLVVQRRIPNSSDWTLVWAIDVMAQAENIVTIPQANEGASLRLWAHQLPDGMIFVDSQFHLAGESHVSSQSSHLLRDGEPVKVDATGEDEAEYRIFHAAAALPLTT